MYRSNAARALGLFSVVALAAMATTAGAQSMMAGAADRAFMMNTSEANLGEIASGLLAEQRGSSPAVRSLGKRFVDNHRTNQQQLTMLAQRLHVMLPMHPSAADQMAMQQLKALHGRAFDSAYLSIEQKGHMKNIRAFKAEAGMGASAPVVAFAKMSLPVLEEHLQLATDDASHMHMGGMTGMSQTNAMPGTSGMGGTSGASTSGNMGGSSGAMGGKPSSMNGSGVNGPGSPTNNAGQQNAVSPPLNGSQSSGSATNGMATPAAGSSTPNAPTNGSTSTVPGSPSGR